MNREFADRDEDEETDLPEDGDEVTDSDAGESGPRDDSGIDHRSRRRGGRGRRRRGGRGHGGASRAQRSRRDRIHRDPHDDERGDAPGEDRDVDSGRSDSRGDEHDDLDREPAARGAADDDAGDAGFPRGEGGDPTAEDPLDDPADDDGSDSDDFGDGAGDLLIRRDNVFGTAEEDAVRRDFTINALFYDVDENVVIDYVGGADDLARRVIRTIGDPEIRFQEDPVRILRAIKFAARLGFTFDEATYAALVKYRGDLRKCAPPRLTEELLKILACGAAARAFELMRSTGVLETILPEIHDYIERDPEPTALRAESADGDQGSPADRDFADDSEGRDDSLAEDGDEESGGDEESETTSEEAGETAPESRETESGTTPRLSAADQIRRYLEVIDEADRGRRVFGNATLFCALLLGPIKEAISQPGGPRDPGMAADKVMRPFAQRMAISRRDAFRVKQIVVALPRFRRPKNSRRRRRVKPIDLVKRDYFKDALDFYRIECAVRGTHDDAEIRRWLDLYYGWLRNANPREWRRARTEAPFDDFGRSAERRPSGPASDRPSSGTAGGPEGGARDEARDDREPGPGQDDREGGGRRRRRRGRGRNRDRDRGFGPEPGAEGAPELESSEGDEVSEAELTSGDAERSERGDDRGEGHGDARGRRRRRGRGRGRGDGEESGRPAGEIAPEEDAAQEPEEDDPIVEIDWNAPFPTVDDPGPISMIRTGVDQTEKRGRRRRRRLDGAARELSKEVEDQPALQALKMIEGDPRGHEATRPRKNKRKDDDRSRTDRDPPFDFVADFESIEDVFRW